MRRGVRHVFDLSASASSSRMVRAFKHRRTPPILLPGHARGAAVLDAAATMRERWRRRTNQHMARTPLPHRTLSPPENRSQFA